MKAFKSKWALALCAVLALFYFTNDFALIDIEKTAIVVAIGIDESDEGYEVTAQIALPQATDTASSNDDAVLTSRGKTMFEAIENVASKSGWYAKLSFCGLVILGRKVAETSALELIDYMIASEKFENSMLAVVSDATTFSNPLDNASNPIIPEPPNISRKDLPSKSPSSENKVLKTLILTFDKVGLTIFSSGAFIFLLLYFPAVIFINYKIYPLYS